MPDVLPLLSDAWLDLYAACTRELPERPGATALVEYRLMTGKQSTAFHTQLEDGRTVAIAAGPADEPDFAVQLAEEDFTASLRGEFDVTVGFMQGEAKVTGDIGRLLSVLPVTTSEEWRAALARIAARTAPAEHAG